MLLAEKHALVFAATGAIGGEVARAMAREGAHVWLSGRDGARAEAVAAAIRADGGAATADAVDATDPAAVAAYVARVAERAGRIDAAFNAIGLRPAELGYPAESATLDFDLFMKPQRIILGSTFLTARAAGARMVRQGGGAIVTLSSTLNGSPVPFMAALTATCGAIEALSGSLAAEFGPAGVRVNCVRAGGMAETRTIRETNAGMARLLSGDRAPSPPPPPPVLPPLTVAETAALVAYLASDAASGLTAQTVVASGRRKAA